MLQDQLIEVESDDFHLTDAIADHAASQIDDAMSAGEPFLQYIAFTAPHWPLHAWEDDIVKYEGKYMRGWDEIRAARHEEQKGIGDCRFKMADLGSGRGCSAMGGCREQGV